MGFDVDIRRMRIKSQSSLCVCVSFARSRGRTSRARRHMRHRVHLPPAGRRPAGRQAMPERSGSGIYVHVICTSTASVQMLLSFRHMQAVH